MLEVRTSKGRLVWGAGPALRISALAVAVGAIALYHRSTLLPGFRDARVQFAEYLFMLCASVALIALYAGFAERWRLRRFFQSSALIFPGAALLAAGAFKLGMYQFGGWDEGLLVHAGTYYAQGFRPYVDFPCTMPPLFMAGVRAGVTLLGLKWTSFAFVSAAFAALTTLWIFVLFCYAGMPRHWAMALTICVELSTMWAVPFWWYNNSSAVVVVLLFLSVMACLHQPKSLLSWLSVALSLGLVLASKPNDLSAVLMLLALLAVREQWRWAKLTAA
jgi:hypothetical protein